MGNVEYYLKKKMWDSRIKIGKWHAHMVIFEELGSIARIDGIPITYAETFKDKTERRFWLKGWNAQDEKAKVTAG